MHALFCTLIIGNCAILNAHASGLFSTLLKANPTEPSPGTILVLSTESPLESNQFADLSAISPTAYFRLSSFFWWVRIYFHQQPVFLQLATPTWYEGVAISLYFVTFFYFYFYTTNMDPVEISGATPKSDIQLQAVARVQLKLPPYWPNDPELWFTQVDAQFITRGITVEKYAYIVSSLQSEYAQEVRDVLLSPPTSEPYTHLKSELIKRTSASELKRLHQLLTAEELGDRKPTQLLRRMEQLLGGAKLESSIFTQLFLQRLPHHAKSILASSRYVITVNQLAQLADRIIEVHVSSTPGISNIISPNAAPSLQPSDCSDGDDVKSLADQVQQLTLQVQSLTKELHQDRGRPSRSPRRGRYNRSRSRSRDGEKQNTSYAGAECWYHWRYGDQAQRCTSPCSYQPQSQEN